MRLSLISRTVVKLVNLKKTLNLNVCFAIFSAKVVENHHSRIITFLLVLIPFDDTLAF